MTTLEVILMITCMIFLIALGITLMIAISLTKRYNVLKDMFNFYDSLLEKLIKISSQINYEATHLLDSSLIQGIPEVQALFLYVKEIRDKYRGLSKEYNKSNKFGNQLNIED